MLFVNDHDYKVLVTLGARNTRDYWLEPHSVTPFQFPPGDNYVSLAIPNKGQFKLNPGTETFIAGECRQLVIP